MFPSPYDGTGACDVMGFPILTSMKVSPSVQALLHQSPQLFQERCEERGEQLQSAASFLELPGNFVPPIVVLTDSVKPIYGKGLNVIPVSKRKSPPSLFNLMKYPLWFAFGRCEKSFKTFGGFEV